MKSVTYFSSQLILTVFQIAPKHNSQKLCFETGKIFDDNKHGGFFYSYILLLLS